MTPKISLNALIVLITVLMSGTVNAWHLTHVKAIHTRDDSAFAFITFQPNPNTPCPNKVAYEVIEKGNSKNTLALLMTAYASGKPIRISDPTTCLHGNSVADYIMLGDWFGQ